MIANILSSKKLNSKVTELFIRGTRLNTSLVFIMLSYFKVPKDVRLKHYAICYYENSKQTRTSTNFIE